MATLSISFTAGRYHATPWGRHVNEGGIDWPPAPWRLLRALLAVGFAKRGWTEPPAAARALIEQLATTLPSYRLPAGGVSHTRHYMPAEGGKTTKVLDTFLRFAGDESLVITWPVTLTPEAAALFAELAAGLTYLGRAESWCQTTVVPDPVVDASWSRPCPEGQPTPQGWDQLTLLAPITADTYARFRSDQMPVATGKKLTKAEAKAAEAFPTDLLACLLTDTATLRDHGWSQPPGSQQALYLRPATALQPAVGLPRRAARRPTTVEAMLLALSSDSVRGQLRPLLTRCLPHLETLHDTAISMLGAQAPACPVLTGRDAATGAPLQGHQHAVWTPLDLDGDSRIDHVLVHAVDGLDAPAQDAIARISQTWGKDLPTIIVCLVGSGDLKMFSRQLRDRSGRPIDELRSATVWTSRTPFLAPRFRKASGKNAIEGQIRAECASRGLPEPQITVLPRSVVVERDFLGFVRRRRSGHPQPPDTAPWALTLTFPRPVTGPIALGYASHFGLGLFAAVQSSP